MSAAWYSYKKEEASNRRLSELVDLFRTKPGDTWEASHVFVWDRALSYASSKKFKYMAVIKLRGVAFVHFFAWPMFPTTSSSSSSLQRFRLIKLLRNGESINDILYQIWTILDIVICCLPDVTLQSPIRQLPNFSLISAFVSMCFKNLLWLIGKNSFLQMRENSSFHS